MYERNAIVLERYFENLLQYRNSCNIRDNFHNYCDLVEKLDKYQAAYQKELTATKEYNEVLEKIKAIQASQEKLYKKSASLEYDRSLIFNNIDVKVEDTRKCIEKVEAEVEKNNEAMKKTKEKLLVALEEYNKKKFELSKSKRAKKISENAYEETLEITKANNSSISESALKELKEFEKFDDTEPIIMQLEKNGKGEKIPFNQDVIENVTMFAVDIEKKIAAGYLFIYDKLNKLLAEIEEGAAKIGLHRKYLRNEKAKMDFLLAVKEYIVQFLDYERMTIIYGKKSHEKLMKEACENFKSDVIQINNLFELLVRETNNKATKKAYAELYNKSYLIDIQEKEEKFRKERNQVNLNTATLMNLNYWRISGIGEIYTIFYKNVSEVFGKDVVEFELPKVDLEEDDDYQEVKTNEITNNEYEENSEEVEVVKKQKKAKTPFALTENYDDIDEKSTNEFDEEDSNYKEDDIVEEETFDIFGEKYKNIDFLEKNIVREESDDLENNLFEDIKSVKKLKKDRNDIEESSLKGENGSSILFKKMKKISTARTQNTENRKLEENVVNYLIQYL